MISSNACPIRAYASAGGAKTSMRTWRSSLRWKYFASPLFLNSSSWRKKNHVQKCVIIRREIERKTTQSLFSMRLSQKMLSTATTTLRFKKVRNTTMILLLPGFCETAKASCCCSESPLAPCSTAGFSHGLLSLLLNTPRPAHTPAMLTSPCQVATEHSPLLKYLQCLILLACFLVFLTEGDWHGAEKMTALFDTISPCLRKCLYIVDAQQIFLNG